MSTNEKNAGKITWMDLTVENAEEVRDFYSKVVGWTPSPVSMGNYNDYNMLIPDSENPAAGICHARGPNASLPPQWLLYINVENIDKSVANCRELGGIIVVETKSMGDYGRYCVIKDPAGAVCALIEPKIA